MSHSRVLLIGLGGCGSRVLRRVKRLASALPAHSLASHRLLAIDQGLVPDRSDLSPDLAPFSNEEVLSLRPDATRVVLQDIAAWRETLGWLPHWKEARLLNELQAISSGGHRWLGRLALCLSEEMVAARLRRCLSRLRESWSEPGLRVIFVAGLGGGTGSAILADLTFLLQRIARDVSIMAFLLLPKGGDRKRRLAAANSYACLREILALRSGTFFQPAFRSASEGSAFHGGWQRLYCFEAQAEEEGSFQEAVEGMALAVTAHLSRPLQMHLIEETQYDVSILGEEKDPAESLLCLGECRAWRSALCAPTVSQTPGSAQTVLPGDAESPSIESTQTPVDPSWEQLRDSLREGVVRLAAEIEQKAEELEKTIDSEGWKGLSKVCEEVSRLEAMLAPAGSNPSPDPRLLYPRIDGSALSALTETWSLRESLREKSLRLKKIPPAMVQGQESASGESAEKLKRFLDDIYKLKREAEDLWGSPQGKAGYLKTFQRFLRRADMQTNLRERTSTLAEISSLPSFRTGLEVCLHQEVQDWIEKRRSANSPLSDTSATEGAEPAANPVQETPPDWQEALKKDLASGWGSVFEQPSPRPNGRAFALAIVPKSASTEPEQPEKNEWKEHLSQSLENILGCKCRVIESPASGDQLLIYYEDLFHAPSELRCIDDLHEAYSQETKPEILHIDPRFLADPQFANLCRQQRPRAVTCGNPGCEADISSLARQARICSGCRSLIRSRCGNSGCSLDDLHLRADGLAKVCSGCGDLNRAAWWVCPRHGKIEVFVPMDMERCLECIARHQDNPARFPENSVSLRPDLHSSRPCPQCLEKARQDPSHKVFWIEEDLLPFYLNGLGAAARTSFDPVAAKYRLWQGFRCPNCQTPLIPYHHGPGVPPGPPIDERLTPEDWPPQDPEPAPAPPS